MKKSINPNQTTVLGELIISPPLSIKEVDFLSSFIEQYHTPNEEKIDQGLYDIIKKEPSKMDSKLSVLLANVNPILTIPLKIQKKEFVPNISCSLALIIEEDGSSNKIIIQHKHKERKDSAQWIVFFIEHFFKQNAIAPLLNKELNFLNPHTLNGIIWQKAGESWNVQKISVENNMVFLQYASTLVVHEEESFNVNILNYNSVLSQKVGRTVNKNKYYKQYHEATILQIAKHNHLTPKELILLPKNNTLDKLILNETLKKTLPLNENKDKIIKV